MSFATAASHSQDVGPSQPISNPTLIMSGAIPGLLDASQTGRLLRSSGSRLSFATFDPKTAFVEKDTLDIHKLSLKEELYRAKRIVIETSSTGISSWRFVPRARMEPGVENEGPWPRVIEICGEIVECAQDQWDIYKLDPNYDCLVRVYPKLSIISRVNSTDGSTIRPPVASAQPPKPRNPGRQTSHPPQHTSQRKPSIFTSARKSRPVKRDINLFEGESSSDEEDEVAEMIVDASITGRAKTSGIGEKSKQFRDKVERDRQARRERNAKAMGKEGSYPELIAEQFVPQPKNATLQPPFHVASGNPAKRRKSSGQEQLDFRDDERGNLRSTFKRHRTVSPPALKDDIAAQKSSRQKHKKERMRSRLNTWREQRHEAFMSDILSQVPEFPEKESQSNSSGHGSFAWSQDTVVESDSEDEDDIQELDAEAARLAAIEESRKKLAELEVDRPVWEQEAQKRAARERVQEDTIRVRAGGFVRHSEEDKTVEQARKAQEEKERKSREQAEALKREREITAKRERERRQRQLRERWGYGPWTELRALERYRVLSEAFDSMKVSPDEPLTFEAVPWPVLCSPLTLSIEDVDWAAVEKFFAAVRLHMKPQDYKTFVETSHRRFHPDRWRSRRLLVSVADDQERGCLEVAANTVAQALTPIWRELKGR